MTYQLILVPSGHGGNGTPVAGSVLGIASYANDFEINAQAFIDSGASAVELPDDVDPGTLHVGMRVTPRAPGLGGKSTYADAAAFAADATPLPEKYTSLDDFVFYNGFGYATAAGAPLGEAQGVTITAGGLSYTTGTGIETVATSGEGRFMTVEITSVGGNGEITGVTVTESGVAYEVGDTLQVLSGDGSAELTIGSVAGSKVGEINSGRGAYNQASANDLNPTYFVSPPFGADPTDLELYIPSSKQILTYQASSLPSPFEFDSYGDCFVGGDFTVQVRLAGSTQVLCEYECPGPQDINSNIDLYAPTA